jgi:hypothetical protein
MSVRTNTDLNGSQLILVGGQTASLNSADQVNPYGRGVVVFINVSLIGTGSITVTIQGKDPASGTYYTILASAAIVTSVFGTLTVYPGAAVTANVSANAVLPRQWRIAVTANNANPVNYSIGASVII